MKCLLFSKCPKKDQVFFERQKRKELLTDHKVVNFAHNVSEFPHLFSKIKERKPDRIVFDGYPKHEVTELIAYIKKRQPGNNFEYSIFSAGIRCDIPKGSFSEKEEEAAFANVA